MIAAFALVLALALSSVSLYVGYTAKQATDQFERDVEEAKAARIEQMITNYYAASRGWGGLQPAIEQASSLYGVRIVVKDANGDVIADSGAASTSQDADSTMHEEFNLPLLSRGARGRHRGVGPQRCVAGGPGAIRIDTRVCAESVAAVDGTGRRTRRCPPGIAVVAPCPCPHEGAQLGGEPPGTGDLSQRVSTQAGTRSPTWAAPSTQWPRTWSRPSGRGEA